MDTQRDTQRERLFYIDFLAFFTGQVTRKDLVTRFGISEPAATKDLSLYADLASGMLEYDLRQRCYLYSGGTPLFSHQVDQSLYSLSGDRVVALDPTHANKIPSWIQFSIKRKVQVEIAAAITRAISQKKKISALYGSMSSGESKRDLSPVAIVHDGLRWHIRCYCHKNQEFRNFNLARFNSVEDIGSTDLTVEDDKEWSTQTVVTLAPHPKAKHKEIICLDYDIEGGTKDITVPFCLVPFFLRHWHVDTTPNATKSPDHHHLFLKNRQDLLDKRVSKFAFDEDENENDNEKIKSE